MQNRQRIKVVQGFVDCHTHCGGIDVNNFYNLRYPCSQDVSILEKTINDNGVNYAITFPMPSTLYFDTKRYWSERQFFASGFEDIPFQIENEYLLSEIDSFGISCVLPFVSISMRDKINEQCDLIRKLGRKYNIYGLKHHTKADQIGIDKYNEIGKPFMELAKEMNIPILIHTEKMGISSPLCIFDLAINYPSIRFCVAHYAGFSKDFYREFDGYKKYYNNVFFDSAPSIFTIRNTLKNSDILDLDYDNPESVVGYFLSNYNEFFLWGTDAPWHFACNLGHKIKRIQYIDEVLLRKKSERAFADFSINAVNRFLFGLQ